MSRAQVVGAAVLKMAAVLPVIVDVVVRAADGDVLVDGPAAVTAAYDADPPDVLVATDVVVAVGVVVVAADVVAGGGGVVPRRSVGCREVVGRLPVDEDVEADVDRAAGAARARATENKRPTALFLLIFLRAPPVLLPGSVTAGTPCVLSKCAFMVFRG